ncbi:MAG TPA: T9SS type A sorting domain-containing protein [Flavisolibacter sp.]
MKRMLPCVAVFVCIVFSQKINAQSCTVSAPIISNISVNSSNGCEITFDLQFEFTGTNGNKWQVVYIWEEAVYNTLSNIYGTSKDVLSTAQLDSYPTLATIAINTQTSGTVTLATYPGDATNPASFKPSLSYSITGNTISIQGITVSVNSCSSQVLLKADAGAANGASLNKFGCIGQGLSFVANEPVVRGISIGGCGATGMFSATFTTTASRDIMFKAFTDVAPLGTFTAADTAAVNLRYGPEYITVNGTYTSSYSYSRQTGDKDLWIVAYTTGISNISIALVENSCAPLPVSFRSFTAVRNRQQVDLRWETATEQNSMGFYVQRNTDGSWRNVAFLFTQADNGNSEQILSYSFRDLNPAPGISQYRIQQVDIDGKYSFSEVRYIRGETQTSSLVMYPNPGKDGRIKIVFTGEAVRDVVVSDLSGRVVRVVRNVRSNSLSLQDLAPGYYAVQVTDLATGLQSNDRFVIGE